MRKPEHYVHILAWGRMMHSDGYYIRDTQAVAAREGAPLDAVFKRKPTPDAPMDDSWCRYRDVTNPSTRWVMDKMLGDLAAQGVVPLPEADGDQPE